MPKIKTQDINGNWVYVDLDTKETTSASPQQGTIQRNVQRQTNKVRRDNRRYSRPKTRPNPNYKRPEISQGKKRTEQEKQKLQENSDYQYNKQKLEEAQDFTATALGNFSTRFFPSFWARTAYDAATGNKSLGGSWIEGNNGLGHPVANLAFDVVSPIGIAKGIKMVNIPLKDTARTLNNARLIQKWKDAVKNFKDRANFKSELDWSPESWFSTRPNYIGYTKEDAIELAKHIPEYHKIERIAKANGTWLKMPDGTTWPGDPRSWVQYMSKNVQKHNPEQFWTGIRHGTINPEYNQQVWGTYGQGKLSAAKARTYAEDDAHVLPMFSEKKVPTTQYDANGSVWFNINGKKTNDIVNQDFANGINTVKINNVTDTGPNIVTPNNSKYSWGDAMTDYDITNSAGVLQNDIIISPSSFRKSLLGNNGAFNHPTNMFRTLSMPFSTFAGYSIAHSK